ncbi:MAG: mannose-1-phosphate guanylyltransferase/mannose-6-phosphate isomerase [Gallionellales bacterium 35-53-114]|jgi:mannose-1-phosphate guanylyltransferase/mannose-6-phosphate isomerase|nr:MAG: mannose-1-phosphate guanylyltransferase/mannose-6-phosphate isomerase [Gallionellales bacterium 35-53-114]OYZ63473.1 MAG: mannose-1-phosphate guanylyltransferase/mannose-6-phosphate isomerase [Gallionellales bacterium 24-53-125]OZB10914.1 MAG: mannose-1-phosphate guanylyltransferase/mannose-6-phosphate isomerase [Gallionellales bacterium 39-52-133]HQS58904.1 mannose-1-phosphate guanylyltransferase/mannose-6-phosphate isomerase [Gallionellaceae bacterium]HQS75711.1 mannose-1-phosphate gu
MSKSQVSAVILAGGSGSRLWPMSRQNLPKQFLALDGEFTLLQTTINRLSPTIEAKDVLIVTQEAHAKGEAYHALLPYQSLFEPVGRNTAPAIALAAAYLTADGTDPVMVVLPADHIIKDEILFRAHLDIAVKAAESGKLVTFGIQPTRPDTGFGYIKVQNASALVPHFGKGGPGGICNSQEICAVERFTEKPDLATAERFLKEGSYYWNSGMFVWKASVILAEIKLHLPAVYQIVQTIIAESKTGKTFQQSVEKHFAAMPSISIDYGVLEKSDRVSLIPCDIGWNDVGSWQAVHEISAKDENGNALQGNVIAVGCKNSLIRAEKRLVAAIGVEDLCIIETADAVLISKSDQTQRVREVVDALQQKGATEHIYHMKVNRPWGNYAVLEEDPDGFKIKRIEVAPGARLSLQSHKQRSEHWVVVSGTATVTNGEEVITVHKNQSTYIPIGTKHRLENRGSEPLHIVEIQVGEYLGEDDIQRYEDNYGR